MIRDNRAFHRYFLKAFKGSMIGLLLVPVFYLALNPNFDANFFPGLWISLRIGFEVVFTNLIVITILAGGIHFFFPVQFLKLRTKLQFRFILGFLGMAMGLLVASTIEPTLGGKAMSVQGLTTGLTIGGLTYLVFLWRSAFNDSQNHNLKLRAESAESNLNVLKNQMQPHFLFNSLNSLSELIESDHANAASMTQKLSDLYREILESSKAATSTLQTELDIVKKYLELETLRFGDRLQFEMSIPLNLEKITIPSLLLQTLAENAVKHGISPLLKGGKIILKIEDSKGGYQFEIKNNSPDLKARAPSTGTGLRNSEARLNLLYGDQHRFQISTELGWTTVKFWIPGEKLA